MFNMDFYKKAELLHLSTLIENKCNIKTVIREHITRTKTQKYHLYISDESLKDFIDLINTYYDSNLIIKKPSVIYAPGSKEFSILIGLLLGDGSLSLSTGFTGTARYEHTCKHYDFLAALSDQWLPLYFEKSSATPWPKENPTQWWRGSQMLPELFDLYTLWYKPECVNGKKVKIIPLNLLETNFNEISLAHWFMDDGYFYNRDKTFYFCTDNFTFVECEFLAKLLHKKCNIKATVNKRTTTVNSITTTMWRIRVSRSSVCLFRQLVKPYLLPVFYYKLGSE
uniref:Putative LAGLIDADG homing endonuclease n=1 Tax=Stigeoclonium helveticum TaxID=55999 RepID=A0A6M4SP50_STIHE|nr:putative LAGLIDADG homing endonuclease [Stigeoclonium helveticum]